MADKAESSAGKADRAADMADKIEDSRQPHTGNHKPDNRHMHGSRADSDDKKPAISPVGGPMPEVTTPGEPAASAEDAVTAAGTAAAPSAAAEMHIPQAWTRSTAGVVGAAAALGFGEWMGGRGDAVPSLVVAVGELVADYTPGDVIAASIATLGTSQKTALTVGITLVSLIIGGVLGRFTTRQQLLPTVAGFAAFGVLGGWAAARNPFSSDALSWRLGLSASLLGMLVTLFLISRAGTAAARSPSRLSSRSALPPTAVASPTPRTRSDSGPAEEPVSGTPSGSSLKTGDTDSTAKSIAASDLTPPAPPALQSEPSIPESPHAHSSIGGLTSALAERRAFLAWVGGAGAAALAMAGLGRYRRGPSAAETARSAVSLSPRTGAGFSSGSGAAVTDGTGSAVYTPVAATSPITEQIAALDTLDDVAGLAEYVTPNGNFYRIDTALTVPQVNPDSWRLRFTGMVDSPYELTFDEILGMELGDYVITLSCVSNEVGGDLVGNAVWTGVPLGALLDRAGVQPGATQVVGRSVDDWTAGFPTGVAYDGRNAILAVGMNGEPLPLEHGFPARLVVAGLYGYVSAVKWIEEIRLTTWDGFDAYWVPKGWSKEGPMKTQSRIDVPRGIDTVPVGVPTPIAGVAWAPTRGIAAVEVRVDDGRGWGSWTACEIGGALGSESWVQWLHTWIPRRVGRHHLQVRSTDGSDITQGQGPVKPRPDGAEGWHTVNVDVHA